MKPYPKTKPSGVEWLGEVPKHWEIERGRFVMEVNPPSRRLRSLKPGDEVSFVPMDSVGVRGGLNLDRTRALGEISGGYTEFQDGDVILAKITPCFENGKAALANGLVNGVALGTTELHVLRAGFRLDHSFLFYTTLSDTFQKLGESEMYGAGGQRRVPPEFCKNYRAALPPLEEQTAIAAYLDRETGRIDALVGKNRELIERLKEKRTALISRTVTCGLPADLPADTLARLEEIAGEKLPLNPPLKRSGIDWLGDVPEHWEIVPLGYLVQLTGGATPDKSNPEYWDGTIPWVSPKDMKTVRIHDAEDHVSSEALANSALHMVPVGAVLIVVRGMILAHSFPVARTTVEVTINQDMKAVICGRRLAPEFLLWSFVGHTGTFVSFTDESAHGTRKLESNTLKRFPFLLPRLHEQHAIAAYLDQEAAKIDALVAKVETAIERLQEYRSALITAAVTGKIDVREQVV